MGGPSVFGEYESIGNALLYLIRVQSAIREVQCVLQGSLCDGLQSFFGEKSLMGGDHDIGEGQESGGGGMFQNLVRTVLEDVVRLFLVDIQTNSGEFMQADPLNQVLGLDQSTSGGVDENHAVLHLLDGVELDQVVGGIHQRAVKRDQIAFRQ